MHLTGVDTTGNRGSVPQSPPSWTCPECGRTFANKGQWHSCLDLTVEEHLRGRSDLARAIYRAVVEALEAAGRFRVHPQKTRIAFISRMTFAGVSLARNWVDLSFILPEPLDDARMTRLELFGASSWGHTVRLHTPVMVDEEVRGWLAEALRRGDQETLDPDREVMPLTGRQMEVFRAAFAGRVQEGEITLPRVVGDALALLDEVDVRIGGVTYQTTLERDSSRAWLPVDPSIGLGEGESADVTVKVAL